MTNRSRLTLTALTLVAAGAFAPVAQASGFQLREQSASSQGNAFAGVSAGGFDISAMFFNPATMTLYSGNQFSLGATLIAADAKASNISGTRTSALAAFPAYEPISGPSSHKNAVAAKVAPNLYGMWSLSDDLKLGFSVNAPYGFVTEYDSNFVGRYHALKTDLKIVDVAPSLAYRINQQWSVGVAFIARYADATLTNAVDFGLIGLNPIPGVTLPAGYTLTLPGTLDGTAKLTGNTWAYGYKVGATYQPTEKFRLGFAYSGQMTMTLKGDIAYTYSASATSAQVAYFQSIGLRNGGGKADLDLPANASIGFNYQVNDTFSLQGEAQWTGWSRFKQLDVKFTDNAGLPITHSLTDEHWRDTYFYSLGGNWKLGNGWSFRGGLGFDLGAVTDGYRTPRIPDGDRTWASLGATYNFSKSFSVDAGYTHLFVKDSKVELRTTASQTDPNFSRGNLDATYKLSGDIFAVQARFKF
jgi:long-chain fatty acid transport protein